MNEFSLVEGSLTNFLDEEMKEEEKKPTLPPVRPTMSTEDFRSTKSDTTKDLNALNKAYRQTISTDRPTAQVEDLKRQLRSMEEEFEEKSKELKAENLSLKAQVRSLSFRPHFVSIGVRSDRPETVHHSAPDRRTTRSGRAGEVAFRQSSGKRTFVQRKSRSGKRKETNSEIDVRRKRKTSTRNPSNSTGDRTVRSGAGRCAVAVERSAEHVDARESTVEETIGETLRR